MKIYKPLGICEIGGRENNEDFIYPPKGKALDSQDFFIVCDGVGGASKGEVASKMVCHTIAKIIVHNNIDIPNHSFLDEMVITCEDRFTKYFEKHPEAEGMGCTLTFLKIHSEGVTVAHIGDSRVYQFRNGKIITKTSDHSYVNEMVRAGILTEEEAAEHPKKNVITRAIQGGKKRTKIDITEVKDVKAGDYFLLCTDGIIENNTDAQLVEIISENISNEEKMDKMKKNCEDNPNDNFSAYLIKIKVDIGSLNLEKEEIKPSKKTTLINQIFRKIWD